jgi:hypothetical protein
LVAVVLSFISFQASPAGASEVTVWQLVAQCVILPLGVSAPFAATVLGSLSISRIRNSQGQLIGMPLAVAVALLYPLLALDGGLLLLGYLLGQGLEYWRVYLATAALIAVGLDIFIVRSVWRAVTKPVVA